MPQGRLPTFQLILECDSAICIKVTFADGEEDMIAANEYHEERHPNHDVFKGKLLSTKTKAVVILGEGDKKDLLLYFRGASPKSIVSNMKELINVESRISLHTYAVKI